MKDRKKKDLKFPKKNGSNVDLTYNLKYTMLFVVKQSKSPNSTSNVSCVSTCNLKMEPQCKRVMNGMFSSTIGSIYKLWKVIPRGVHHFYDTLPHTDN